MHMLHDLKLLLEIQELDVEIIELNNQLAKYPVIWEEVKQQVAKDKETHERALKAHERHERERRRIEQKIRMFSEDLRRSQTKQQTVKTSKEYEALAKQIDTLKQKLSQLEEQGLELINKDEEVVNAIESTKDSYEKAQEFYKTEKERIRGQFNEKKTRIAELEKEKERLMGRVADKIASMYNRLTRQHPGSAAVPVRSGSCSGCHFGLLPNDLVKLHRGDSVIHCPNCNRILTEDEDYVPEEQEVSTG